MARESFDLSRQSDLSEKQSGVVETSPREVSTTLRSPRRGERRTRGASKRVRQGFERRRPTAAASAGDTLRAVAFAVLIVLSAMVAVPLSAGTAAASTAPTLTMSGGDARYAIGSGPTPVDPSLDVTDGSQTIDGARVIIDNPRAGDELVIDDASGSPAATHGVTGSYDPSTDVLMLSGSATASEYEEILRTVEFRNTQASPDRTTRDVTFSLGTRLPYSGTGHYYEFVADSAVDWNVAQTEADSRSYFGLQGYLVTVTSQAENDFVAGKLEGEGWIGASDRATEGTWQWVTGPEAGDTLPPSFNPDQSYANWETGEPNDSGGEDRAHYRSDGTWNDYANSDDAIAGYVVEYGGSAGDSTITWRGTKQVSLVDRTDPTADASNSETAGDEDAAIDFDGTASFDTETFLTQYEWDWTGDGTYDDAGAKVIHTYADPGTKTVTLRVTDDGGNTDTDTVTVSVADRTAPTADASNSETSGDEDAAISFDATGSTDNGKIATYEWDWTGDGTYDDTGAKVTHTYADPGSYTVTLRVTDGGTNTDTDTVSVDVADRTAPTADASNSETAGDEDAAISFDATGSTDNGKIVTYEWDWTGDGTYDDTGAKVAHTYADPGNKTVTLRVTDGGGNADTDTVTVDIADRTAPTADAGGDKTASAGLAAGFDATGSTDNGEIATYEWDWTSDGQYDDTGANVTHLYMDPGSETVTLRVTDDGGNADTDTATVAVFASGSGGTSMSAGQPSSGDAADRSVAFTIRAVEMNDPVETSVDGVGTDVVVVEALSVNFDRGTNADTQMNVRAGSAPPTGVTAYRGGSLRAYVSVELDSVIADSVSRGQITFRLAPGAMPDDPTAVTAYRFHDGAWHSVDTTYEGDRRFLLVTPGFSTFAVVVGDDAIDSASDASDDGTSTGAVESHDSATVTSTSSSTSGTSESSTSTPTGTSGENAPGFGVVVVIVALTLVVARLRTSGR